MPRMSLSKACISDGKQLTIEGKGPFSSAELSKLVGVDFLLPPDDPWVEEQGTRAHAYVDGARTGWEDHPEWMDFLDPSSPCWALKQLERDVYLHWWQPWVRPGRVLDVGCGVGRFVQPFMDAGAQVWGVDADMESLRRCAWHAAGRTGALDLFWSSAHVLPEVHGLDVAVCCEVLCYVPDAAAALEQIVSRLRPGGVLLLSLEARWGWATAEDAPRGALDEAIGGAEVLYIPGDRWVRTYEKEEVEQLLLDAGLSVHTLVPTHYVTDGPLERSAPEEMTLEYLLTKEEQCRNHPVWGPLNRAWTAVAIKG